MPPENSLPLADLRVVDLTIARAGPTAVRQLADWGADVIQIVPKRPEDSGGGAESADWLNLHRNKRSLTLDLKSEAGRSVLDRLIERADVLVENMRPPVKARLGFDWERVSRLNPRIVMGSISGFGQDGPYAERGGVDQIAQGMGGMMHVTGNPGEGPQRAGVAISDITAGLQLAVGILVALHERERTGKGRYVQTSLLESMIGMLDFQAARWTVDRENPPPAGNHHPTMGPMGLYPTADGHVNIAAPWGRLWDALCEALESPELARDSRFATAGERAKNRRELEEHIGVLLSKGSTESWVERLNAHGIPCGPVHDVQGVFGDPQVRHLQIATPIDHPSRGRIEILRNATRILDVSEKIRRRAPGPGEHSREILEELGLSVSQIGDLLD